MFNAILQAWPMREKPKYPQNKAPALQKTQKLKRKITEWREIVVQQISDKIASVKGQRDSTAVGPLPRT